jgi:hypothetical protein
MGDAFGVMSGEEMKSALRVRAKMLGGHENRNEIVNSFVSL